MTYEFAVIIEGANPLRGIRNLPVFCCAIHRARYLFQSQHLTADTLILR